MDYTILTKDWRGYGRFRHYCDEAPCAITMQGRVDVTALYQAVHGRRSFTGAMLYCAAYIANNRDEFRLTATREGEPALWDEIHPAYTVFHEDDDTCTATYTRYTADPAAFLSRDEEDAARAGSIRVEAVPMPRNTFYAAVLPWYDYDAVALQYGAGTEIPLAPMIVCGRLRRTTVGIELPVTLSIHHAAADAYQVSRFFLDLGKVTAGVAKRL